MKRAKEKPAPYEPQWLPSPLDLPERRVGCMAVRHRIIPVGGAVSIVGMRQAIVRGTRACKGLVEAPLRIHELVEYEDETSEKVKGLWMTDLPEELNQIGELLHTVQPRGAVLVGGLGLGILARCVATWPGVDSVTVVERAADVIALTGDIPSDRYTRVGIVHADIKQYLETTSERFDCYLLDTWAGTNEGTWWDHVVPLRRVIRRRFGMKPIIHGWAEDIMLGQIMRNLTTQPPHWWSTHLPVPMSIEEATWFAANVGSPKWENLYGGAIDRYAVEYAAQCEQYAAEEVSDE